jgi:sulfhydrogenase subunit beta (sulfur reductase)
MQWYAILEKKHFNDFISEIAKGQKVVAPVAKGYHQFAFEEVTSGNQISLNYIPTILPPKKYFMPQNETIATYDTSKGQNMKRVVEYEELVLFGVHTCDLAGIQCLNIAFSEHPKDII